MFGRGHPGAAPHAGAALPLSGDPNAFAPGDIVLFRLRGTNLPHIGIISDQRGAVGEPLVTHNIGYGARTENMLLVHKRTGHYRLDRRSRAWLAAR